MKGEINGAPAILDLAAWNADDVVFPAAMATDRADRVPTAQVDLLAARGLRGGTLTR